MISHPRARTRTFKTRSALVRGCVVVAAAVGIGALVLPTPASAHPPVVQTPQPRQAVTLVQGARGADVATLQRALLAAGIRVRGGADGIFGPATRAAVVAFQQRKGLQPNGKVDHATASALGITSSPAPAPASATGLIGLSMGSRGAAVKTLQQKLIAAGITVRGGADGIFGPATRAAVVQFQSWNGLQRTGTATQATVQWLDRAAPAAATGSSGNNNNASSSPWVGLKQGARGDTVKSLQAALLAAGIRVRGGADGIFGPATRAAVVTFQKQKGLGQTGTVDSATASKLSKAKASSGGSGSAASGYVGLKQGSRGNAVRDLQRGLMQSGLALRGGADGIFGPATKATLIVFQRVNGLSQTGVLSAKGAGLLALGSASSGIVSTVGFPVFGERSTRVKDLQRSLMKAGISVPGGADGSFGGSTAGAVMEFQRRNGLAVTGKVDSATASKLALAAASAPPPPSSTGIAMKVFPVQGRCWFGNTWLAPRGAGRTHQGLDIIAAEGKLLYAVVDGTISKRYFDYPGARAGNGLRITQPNGTYFTYLHMLDVAPGIKVGTKVKAGDVVGFVGSTGNSGTAHLHMEIHPNGGAAINPYPLVKAINACSVTAPRT